MSGHSTGILVASGQMWKLELCTLLAATGGFGLFAVGTSAARFSAETFLVVVIALLVTGVAGVTWCIASLQCPVCASRWLWHVTLRGSLQDVTAIGHLRECPTCHAPAESMLSDRKRRSPGDRSA